MSGLVYFDHDADEWAPTLQARHLALAERARTLCARVDEWATGQSKLVQTSAIMFFGKELRELWELAEPERAEEETP